MLVLKGRRKSCPHCGDVYDTLIFGQYRAPRWGSVLRRCQRCHQYFVDTEYREAAAYPPGRSRPRVFVPSELVVDLLLWLAVICLTLLALMRHMGGAPPRLIRCVTLYPALALLGAYGVNVILNAVNLKANLERWSIELRASQKRLKDPGYANMAELAKKR